MPIALSDSQLCELMQAAQLVPLDLRNVFLERVAARLRGKDLGDGLVRGVAIRVGAAAVSPLAHGERVLVSGNRLRRDGAIALLSETAFHRHAYLLRFERSAGGRM